MPVKSTRFRNKKINYKQKLAILTGSLDVPLDEISNDPSLSEEPGRNHPTEVEKLLGGEKGPGHVETGVDKEEESEHHLQQVINANLASFNRSSRATAGAPGSPGKAALTAHIPTPDATGSISQIEYDKVYLPNSFTLPSTYIRSSETVEDCIGIGYCMDEEDEDWLVEYNATIEGNASVPPEPEALGRGNRSASKAKGKDRDVDAPLDAPISEDDFELVMDQFERITEEKEPMLRTDLSRIPTRADLEATFVVSPLYPRLALVKPFARSIYPHWRDRRTKRDGKMIIPSLDFDETDEENPYVCFRRREIKLPRKTRRAETHYVERLVRLRTDLTAARELVLRVLERERIKKDSLEAESKVFEIRCTMRELKRRTGEYEGDEDILISKRDKRRKEAALAAGAQGSLRVPLRLPRADANPAPTAALAEPMSVYKERAAAMAQRIERDLQRKREADAAWEDWTDGAFVPRPLNTPAKHWRAAESVMLPSGPEGQAPGQVRAFAHHFQPVINNVRQSFRRRVGRGGRILVDRLAMSERRANRSRPFPLASDDEMDKDAIARLAEKWRYDSDVGNDLPFADDPMIIDDYELQYSHARLGLLRPGDAESLQPNPIYLEHAENWLLREPEKLGPLQVVGRLPIRAMTHPPAGASLTTAQQQQQLLATPNQSAVVSQMMAAAANHAAASQAQLRNRANANAQAQAQQQALANQRRAPNGSPLPVAANVPGPASGLAGLQQWQNMNGIIGSQVPTAAQAQQFAALQNGLQYAQRIPANGQAQQVIASPTVGANGLPATSRLSAPPYSGAPPTATSPATHGLANGLAVQRPPSQNGQYNGNGQAGSPRIAANGTPFTLPAGSPNVQQKTLAQAGAPNLRRVGAQ
ncbi:uncharacterized protein L969DRAFT_61165 [Mixia osmundae IAM 14324]|uniref:Enhancer of polycomb-like protein n=1 Tax=Mixia osmundae (strain CBS 9802 / IAM 14324 / JCM 22182 / KY 12970) TaxID=764103 RepID=G7E8U6_MIXOS|nr:uncharacterized protein L969DRAFT_61165 [Mixia osmundae IAM 14324]KEI40200.1 hypothetical protein L969DRAFT_61165 [Mixia osmundae IAM 14324]GAA99564.1 hypothetical protein E5Q_06265 [Mixia osmundae IAM 14324]